LLGVFEEAGGVIAESGGKMNSRASGSRLAQAVSLCLAFGAIISFFSNRLAKLESSS
jgi:hypothetical protein